MDLALPKHQVFVASFLGYLQGGSLEILVHWHNCAPGSQIPLKPISGCIHIFRILTYFPFIRYYEKLLALNNSLRCFRIYLVWKIILLQ